MENKSSKNKTGDSTAGRIKASHHVIDMHCDLLYYLARVGDAHPGKTEDIRFLGPDQVDALASGNAIKFLKNFRRDKSVMPGRN